MNAGSEFPDPADARRLLFLQCLEDGDAAGNRLSHEVRLDASKAAGTRGGLEFLTARMGALLPRLPQDWQRAMEAAAAGSGGFSLLPAWLICGAALLAGWFTNSLGTEGTVSLLAFPLLGLILWNLAVSIAAAVREFRPARRGAAPSPGSPPWAARLAGGRMKADTVAGDPWLEDVRAVFQRKWLALQLPRVRAAAAMTFHAAAIALAAGVVGGMYVRGLGRDYRATWESTFLDQRDVTRLLGTALAPASLVTGIPVPAVPPEGRSTDAAPWIHLWAASAGLFIFVPRLILAAMAGRDLKRARPDWRNVFRDWEERTRAAAGRAPVASVIPLQTSPAPRTRDALRRIIQHLWGAHVIVDFAAEVPYGSEDGLLEQRSETPSHLVLLWPFAVTPEAEIHGHLVNALATRLAESRSRALVVLETSGFDARMSRLPEYPRRLAERRHAWDRILGGRLPILLLNAAAESDPAAAAASVTSAREPVRDWTDATA